MSTKPIRNIAIVVRPGSSDTLVEGETIRNWLGERGIDSTVTTTDDQRLREGIEESRFDLLVALGGDGTMLRAGHLAAPHGLPILGINLGKFGFLMQIVARRLDGNPAAPARWGLQDRKPHDVESGAVARETAAWAHTR